ncbi:CatA-like O-acetyltransferase [Oscillibacter sp. PC13]|uniref:CatA-like O-acetyltransferase n=1 Tax=Oscillibacter sp. PC13 TaxID=1855299 RepID=UPI001FA8E8E6|nr:CatA-like O-acetyltransferase [Oscillibacter sp. PC13]
MRSASIDAILFLKGDEPAMLFTPIELQDWPRGQMFYYFSKMAPTGYSMTTHLNVTAIRQSVRNAGVKFFPAYLWLVTKHLNQQVEFKVAERDGVLGYYDVLTPLYASFHRNDHTFSLMWTEFDDNFSEFYRQYLANQQQFGETHGVLCQPQAPPANAYTISCMPWVSFSHFAVHSFENKPYYFPSVEAGKFMEQAGQMLMPLSLTCHHATTDGYHVSRFLKSLQADMDNFQQYLSF